MNNFKMCFRIILSLAVALLSVGVSYAKFHNLESVDGRTMNAEILRFTDSGVVVLRQDGEQYDLTHDMLSAKSQGLLKSLKREYDLSRISEIRVSVSTNRENKDIRNFEGSTREISQYEKRVRIRRPRDLSLDGLTVKYMIFIERDRDDPVENIVTGQYTISDAEITEDYFFKTDLFNLNREYLHAGYWWRRDRKEYQDDDLGIWLKIFDGEKEIFEYSNPGTLQRKREWQHPVPRRNRG
ncbi:MAG: hypothetical protein ACPGN3_18070 [Opitutales bacterium]